MAGEEALAILIFSVTFMFSYLAVNIDKKHGAMQIFFMFCAMYAGIVGVALGIEIAGSATLKALMSSYYTIMLYIPVIVAFYFIIQLVWNLFVQNKSGKEKDDE